MNILTCFLFGFNLILLFKSSLADFILAPNNGIVIEFKNSENGINVTYIAENDIRPLGIIGTTIKSEYEVVSTANTALLNFIQLSIQLKIVVSIDNSNYTKLSFDWLTSKDVKLEDCFQLAPYHWFGGPEQKEQYWPIENLTLKEYSYVTKEDDNSAIIEPYWGNSGGIIFYVDNKVPLFVDQNNHYPGYLCFLSEVKDPYSKNRTVNELKYNIVITKNGYTGHMYAVQNYLGKPNGIPDFKMIQHPIWSTWARYYRPINETIVMNFAKEILENGFNNSHIDIDDLWEICYGSLTIDTRKFPDMKKLVSDLKDLGFRVTMWIHPFINENCEPWFSLAKDKGYLVKTENGSLFTSWWNNNGSRAAHFDFTNPEARFWWINQILELKTNYGFDSFKFDAGESGWVPQVPVLTGDIYNHPNQITIDYVRAIAEFGPMIEIRTGVRTQDLPVFVRMIDKDSLWTFNNGLPTLITTLLQMNMNGYTLVLPDMIGGNGYDEKPSKELFIRWLQANTFMPSLQYSIVPWDFDLETVEICRKYTDLHAEYANVIRDVMLESVRSGTPVNAPIWWIAPDDPEALSVYDEFMLGENILVAPVIEEEAVTRDYYLPDGVWMYQNDPDNLYVGGTWYRKMPAPLDVLIYFVRLPGSSNSTNNN